jgi:mono/diheme cytochrome c family protein
MRLKTLGVLLVTAMAAFTMVYWLTDETRRESREAEHREILLHYGEELYGEPRPEEHIEFTANCAACHGDDGRGDPDALVPGPSLRSPTLVSRMNTYTATTGLNYLETVIRKGGVAVSGRPDSPMPAWEETLNDYQIEALVALLEEWLEEPDEPVDVPDTVEAGQEVYMAVCAACHQADLAGVPGTFPNIANIDEVIGDDLITDIANLDQLEADYADDPRAALERWIRESSFYNDGQPTRMPEFGEDELSDSQLTALITFLLEGDH